MKKGLKIAGLSIGGLIFLGLLVFGTFAIIGFAVGEEEITEPTAEISAEDQDYINAYGQFWADYADALTLMTAISTTDSEATEYDTWKGWIDENAKQWEALMVSAEPIMEYAESEGVEEQARIQLIKPAYAQLQGYWGGTNTYDLPAVDPRAHYDASIRQAYNAAPRGEKISAIIKVSGIDNPKEALAYLEGLREIDRAQFKDQAEFADFMSRNSKRISKGAFVTVAVGGVVLTGGQAVAATSLLAKSGYIVAAGVSGGDLVLELTGDAAKLMDNRALQSASVQARKNIAPAVHAVNVINLQEGIKDAGNITTIYNYAKTTVDWATAADNEETVLMYTFKPGEITLAQSDELYQKILAPADPFEQVIKTIYPSGGGFNVNEKTYLTYTLPQPDVPATGAQGTYKTTEVSYTQTVPDVAGSATSAGSGQFTVDEDGVVSGTFSVSLSGSFSSEGATSHASGDGTGSFSGTFNEKTNTLEASGEYGGDVTVTVAGAGTTVPFSGTMEMEAQLFDDVFIGTATFHPVGGEVTTVDIQAKKQ